MEEPATPGDLLLPQEDTILPFLKIPGVARLVTFWKSRTATLDVGGGWARCRAPPSEPPVQVGPAGGSSHSKPWLMSRNPDFSSMRSLGSGEDRPERIKCIPGIGCEFPCRQTGIPLRVEGRACFFMFTCLLLTAHMDPFPDRSNGATSPGVIVSWTFETAQSTFL
ncbi:MAG: hypothetical protein ACP5OP_06915, partial [Leptospirillia bacterium]